MAGGAITFNPSINPDQAARALTNTMAAASPLVLTGLAVGVGFKAGLFNIGGTGQVLVGGFFAALAGAAVAQQPAPIAFTVAVLAGALGGALYGFIPGALKAFTGAHEVVSTIMLNSLAAFFIVGRRQRHLQDHRADLRPDRRRRQRRAADPLRPERQPRDLHRARAGGPDVGPHLPDAARLRDPDRRREPERRPVRRA